MVLENDHIILHPGGGVVGYFGCGFCRRGCGSDEIGEAGCLSLHAWGECVGGDGLVDNAQMVGGLYEFEVEFADSSCFLIRGLCKRLWRWYCVVVCY